jgi:putative redox protein
MANTSEVIYTGDLRTEATHLQSGNKLITDAPKDNHGKGEAFSPTDLAATSLACCMLSVMGILARKEGITPSDGAKATVLKVMYADPRRIGEIHIEITMPAKGFTDKEKKMYEHAAYTCPVAKSLHPDIKQEIKFTYL